MKKTILLFTAVVLCLEASAQWECPSRLGATLKPIGSSDFMWSAEITGSAGWIKDNYAANTMVILGLNYGKGKNSFYVEGGLKAWTRGTDKQLSYSDDGGETTTYKKDSRSSIMPGLREAFYRYSGEKNTFTLGLQSARSDDQYLLNERVVGANYTFRSNNLKLNVIGGSVMEAFARNGRFCTYGYLYNDIVAGRPRSYVGNDFGDTNMGMVTLAYTPTKSVDEFGGDQTSFLSLDKIGVAAYTEFGRGITNTLAMGGLYSEITLGGVQLKPEILYQSSKNNNAIIYNFTAEKTFHWGDTQITRLYGQYVGYSAIDKGARPVNSFSNLFMGDALHQDVLEAPLMILGIKHSFTAIKTSVKLQGVMQTKASAMGGDYGFITDDYTSPLTKMKELDMSVSKNFGRYLLVNALFGMLEFPTLEHTENVLHYNRIQTMYGRLEFRFTF
jgi:hypothetical protein